MYKLTVAASLRYSKYQLMIKDFDFFLIVFSENERKRFLSDIEPHSLPGIVSVARLLMCYLSTMNCNQNKRFSRFKLKKRLFGFFNSLLLWGKRADKDYTEKLIQIESTRYKEQKERGVKRREKEIEEKQREEEREILFVL